MQLHRLFAQPQHTSVSFASSASLRRDQNKSVTTPRLSQLTQDVYQVRSAPLRFGAGDPYNPLQKYIDNDKLADARIALTLHPVLLEQPGKDNMTPVLYAANEDNLSFVKFFAEEQKGDLTKKDRFGQGIIHLAAVAGANGYGSTLAYLLKKHLSKLDINATDDDGETAVDAVNALRKESGIKRKDIKASLDLLRQYGGLSSTEFEDGYLADHSS